MKRLPKTRKRVPLTVLVLPATLKLLRTLARGSSQGKTVDRAVELLAAREVFGVGHVRSDADMEHQ